MCAYGQTPPLFFLSGGEILATSAISHLVVDSRPLGKVLQKSAVVRTRAKQGYPAKSRVSLL